MFHVTPTSQSLTTVARLSPTRQRGPRWRVGLRCCSGQASNFFGLFLLQGSRLRFCTLMIGTVSRSHGTALRGRGSHEWIHRTLPPHFRLLPGVDGHPSYLRHSATNPWPDSPIFSPDTSAIRRRLDRPKVPSLTDCLLTLSPGLVVTLASRHEIAPFHFSGTEK
jgi:hypothetical protein